jgi:hypothetical protein
MTVLKESSWGKKHIAQFEVEVMNHYGYFETQGLVYVDKPVPPTIDNDHQFH